MRKPAPVTVHQRQVAGAAEGGSLESAGGGRKADSGLGKGRKGFSKD